jgi:hypothetical protein
MAVEIRYSVISPEAGVQRTPGGPPPTGGPPTGRATPRPATTAATSAVAAKVQPLATLENKTIYLVDTGYGGSYKFMQALQKWFSDHMPSVKTIRRRKTGHVFADDTTDLWEEIKQKGDAVVLGVAG